MLIQRAYCAERDQPEMISLARAFPGENLHVIDLPYRFSSWALDEPENAAVWTDESGQIQAWAVLQTPFWTIDCAFRPGQNAFPQILDWADRRAREVLSGPYGHEAWFVNAFSTQTGQIHDLEAAGFTDQGPAGEDAWSKVWMERRVLAPVETSPLAAGFTIRPFAGAGEIDAYVDLHRAVFESKNMTREWRARVVARPEALPELNLAVEAPTGELAAFCISWFEPGNAQRRACGQIEPMGVHPAFRKLGLGRAVLQETLRRLAGLGAAQVYVETDNYRDAAFGLYESVGFRILRDVRVFRKNYP